MKDNIEKISLNSFRVRIPNAPPLSGWALQFSSTEEAGEIKPGYWLRDWVVAPDRKSATFSFSPELSMTFREEQDAIEVSGALRAHADIETKIVRIPAQL
ncbi:MAG TPA: hypothetical protein VGK22_17725 [Candidatus Angelobacter sp.]|jgi:hypothetical protein